MFLLLQWMEAFKLFFLVSLSNHCYSRAQAVVRVAEAQDEGSEH